MLLAMYVKPEDEEGKEIWTSPRILITEIVTKERQGRGKTEGKTVCTLAEDRNHGILLQGKTKPNYFLKKRECA